MKACWTRACGWFGFLVVLAAGLEVALRHADWSYTPHAVRDVRWSVAEDRRMLEGTSLYAFHPHQLWAPRPGALLPWTSGERFNADGYRGPQLNIERPTKTLRIAVLGGAAAMGKGVRHEDTFAALMGRYVSERIMPTEVMNLGVENFSARQCLERYRDLARPYRPHVVILSLRLEPSYREAPGGTSDDEKIRRSRALGDAGQPRTLSGFAASRVLQGLHWVDDALDGTYWEDRDFQFQLDRLSRTMGSLDWPGARRVPIDDFYHSLSLLLQETRQDGAHLILLSIPPAPGATVPPIRDAYQQTLTEFAEREKLIYLDGRSAFLDAMREDIVKEDLFTADQFPSECGHAQLAEALADIVVRGIMAKSSAPRPKDDGSAPR